MEKIAVLAPMPSASDSTAATDTTGVDRSARQASRRSGMSGILAGARLEATRVGSDYPG